MNSPEDIEIDYADPLLTIQDLPDENFFLHLGFWLLGGTDDVSEKEDLVEVKGQGVFDF